MAELPESASASFWRNHLVQIGYAAFGLVLFAGLLFATFPYSATLSKVLAPMGFEFSSASQSIHFPFGAELTGVSVRSMKSSTPYPALECPAVTIAPSLLSLLIFQPGVRVSASLYDGVAKLTIRPSSGGTAISYDLDTLNIAEQQLVTIPAGAASGTISGHGKLWLAPADLDADTGDGELSGAGLAVTSPLASGPILLGSAGANFKLEHGALTIEGLKTSGGDLTVTASGTIQLAPDPAESTLAIEFTLVPEPAAVSRLGMLFALLPHPPNAQPYRLIGTLSAPRII
jgi:type II secretion system protein N